ncbi:MAG: hypoxanthine phosphoribosyltransferase [Paludibacteraceae bacterium]|nr:hypoxanthine phosphoribosyltransferase [Paludibacteraceae bacterium]
MDEVKVLDKVFDLYIPYEEIERRLDVMTKQMKADLEDENPLFVIMLSGAFIFAAELMKRLNFAAEICFVKVSSYVGTKSTGELHEQLGLNRDVKGRTVVIIEDIVESGLTMKSMLEMLAKRDAKAIRIAAAFVKPKLMRYDIKIDYELMEIEDDFIVGFGLDYNQYGRNLRSIYKLKN